MSWRSFVFNADGGDVAMETIQVLIQILFN